MRVLDVSWYHALERRDARAEFEAGHIPGAAFASLDVFADPAAQLPHSIPAISQFERIAGGLGIGGGTHVVAYDASGFRSAPRVWWLFRWAGHERVSVLGGGLSAWRAAGLPVERSVSSRAPETFVGRFGRMPTCDAAAVAAVLHDPATRILDARPWERFSGTSPEPWPGLRRGHIPGSISLPLEQLIEPGTRRLLSPDGLRRVFERAGVRDGMRVITTCGSGVAAAGLVLALKQVGTDAMLYDGSWAEWGAREDLPVRCTEPLPSA